MIATLFFPLLLLQSAEALVECDQAAIDKGIQSAMTECAYREYKIADEALNAQWKITAAAMKATDASFAASGGRDYDTREGSFESLLEAQRGWLRYRDAHCRLDGFQFRGGSMEPMIAASCKANLTRQRTAELKALVEVPG